ncbi:LuxR family transcriptional regulator [Salmonella enterica subsp. enterica serovar Lexington]|uniref:Helix-turn-helix transcriptional regulator n=1 Tax=Salmonella enterica TaxID=28901 RepID=A0A5Y5T992_SALER|nr:helix-turn-helix transcriptional regulator [Salmonella enterica]EAA1210270.1 LuxR family transcriptional regulator [Salmonella enterica subsp. enterica serovar Bareilly]EAA8755098.1 LuxR family transcriptional regulator [Salmonella enterica subsp. enterica serovar Weltevreden]EAC0964190.1 LuxR family transcriptional regulator [Salmonella enterica subsp. enterica serovar Newport]EBR9008020.1 LuxR family transcriptional regulator [Salmonella enterica subsp. enterica serovar Richmond]EBU742701
MRIFTTARDVWLLEGLRHSLQAAGCITSPQIISLESAGALLTLAGNGLSGDSVLLPVFPDNDPGLCLRSFAFLNEWRCLQTGLFHYRAPCIQWGESSLICNRLSAGHLPVIPWRASPQQLGKLISSGVQTWRRRTGRRAATVFHPKMNLSPREVMVLRYTLDGHSLNRIAEEMGISNRTVWTHRRRAMNTLGIRRLHDLMQVSSGVLNQMVSPVRGTPDVS